MGNNKKAMNMIENLKKKADAEGEITNDGGLSEIRDKIRDLDNSGELEKLPNKDLMELYMSMVRLSSNKVLINTTRIALIKKNRKQLIELVRHAGVISGVFSANANK